MSTTDRPAGSIDPKLLEILVCPITKGPLEYDAEKQELISRSAKLAYPIRDGIPIMLADEARRLDRSVILPAPARGEALVRISTKWICRASAPTTTIAAYRGGNMMKIWGRNTSANVQKAMWAIGEMGLKCERIDVGGPFGKNNEAPYLAMNPMASFPLSRRTGFILWGIQTRIVRYLAADAQSVGTLQPSDLRDAGLAPSSWMD